MRMNADNMIILPVLLIMLVMGGLFIYGTRREIVTEDQREREDKSQRIARDLSEGDLEPGPPSTPGPILRRYRRGFRSFFYNYLDEMAMAICSALPAEGPGLNYAVRRTCGDDQELTCNNICTDQKLKSQAPKDVQTLRWSCSESLHIYKRQPSLSDNYENYSDSYKLGLAVYRHNSCTTKKCGPNYCCCRAVATAASTQ